MYNMYNIIKISLKDISGVAIKLIQFFLVFSILDYKFIFYFF